MRDVTVFDQPLDLRSRVIRDLRREEAVKPVAGVVRFGREFQAIHTNRGLRGPRDTSAGSTWVVVGRLRYHSMNRLSGASTTEMNCDVESTFSTMPRSSPRKNSMMKRSTAYKKAKLQNVRPAKWPGRFSRSSSAIRMTRPAADS